MLCPTRVQRILLWAAMLPLAASASAQLFTVSLERGVRAIGDDTIAYTLYIPQEAAGLPAPPWPAVVLSHGYNRDQDNHAINAFYMAQRGIIVLTPQLFTELNGSFVTERNIGNTIDNAAWLAARAGGLPSDPLYRRIDPARIALAGHSAGGAVTQEATLGLAAAGTPPAAVLLLDSVYDDDTLPRLSDWPDVPFLNLRAESEACNLDWAILDVMRAMPRGVTDVLIHDTGHYDAENPHSEDTLFCREPTVEHQAAWQRLIYLFLCEALGAPAVNETVPSLADALARGEAEGKLTVTRFGRLGVNLALNGLDPSDGVVTTSGQMRLTLTIDPGAYAGYPLDWYFGYVYNYRVYCLTPSGFSMNPLPWVHAAPVTLSNAQLLNTSFPRGTRITFFFMLADGATFLTQDWITAVVN